MHALDTLDGGNDAAQLQVERIPVEMATVTNNGALLQGHLQLIDNQFDAASGTIKALFTGDSGTGKTLAAEVIAAEAGAPLIKVDLARVEVIDPRCK